MLRRYRYVVLPPRHYVISHKDVELAYRTFEKICPVNQGATVNDNRLGSSNGDHTN